MEGVINIGITLIAIPLTGFIIKWLMSKVDKEKAAKELQWHTYIIEKLGDIKGVLEKNEAKNVSDHKEFFAMREEYGKRLVRIDTIHRLKGCANGYLKDKEE